MNFVIRHDGRMSLKFTYLPQSQTEIQFPTKGIIFHQLFQNYSQTEVKEEQRNWRLMGRITETHVCSCCYYGNGVRWRRNKYTSGFAWT